MRAVAGAGPPSKRTTTSRSEHSDGRRPAVKRRVFQSPLPTVALFSGVLLAGCTADAGPESVLTERDSAGLTITTIRVDPDAVPEWTTGRVERVISGAEPPHFGRLGAAVWLAGGGIAAVDRLADQVHVFDRQGSLVRTLGGSGDGPGEFRNIWSVAETGDSLMVHDLGHDRVSIFDSHGRLTRSFQLPVQLDEDVYERTHAIAPMGGGRYVAKRLRDDRAHREEVTPNARRYQTRDALTLHDSDGSIVAGPVRFTGGGNLEVSTSRGWADARVFFDGRSITAVAAGRLVYGNGATFALTLLDSLLQPVRSIRWPGYADPLDPDEVAAVREDQIELFASEGMADMGRELLDAALHPDILPEYRPALGQVLLDPDGRIWAGRFEPLETPREWLVLALDGSPLARLTLPEGTRLADVRDGRLLIVTRDSLDVESIEVRTIRQQPAMD